MSYAPIIKQYHFDTVRANWGTGIRTPITGTKTLCLAVRRSPTKPLVAFTVPVRTILVLFYLGIDGLFNIKSKTTSQIQNMTIGDLVLTKEVNGQFVLNYDIEQSEDLRIWSPYQAFALPMTNLPTNKAFVRIKAKNGGSGAASSDPQTPVTDSGSAPIATPY